MKKIPFLGALGLALMLVAGPASACDTGIKVVHAEGVLTYNGHYIPYVAIMINFDDRTIAYKQDNGFYFTPANSENDFEAVAERFLQREVTTNC